MKRRKTAQPLRAILIGWTWGPVMEAITQLAKSLRLTPLSAMEATSMMWMRTPSPVLGVSSLLGLGAWLGLLIYYSVKLWSTDYFPIKAALVSLTGEALFFQLFGSLSGNKLLILKPAGSLVHALAAAAAGILTGYLIKKYLLQAAVNG